MLNVFFLPFTTTIRKETQFINYRNSVINVKFMANKHKVRLIFILINFQDKYVFG